MVNKLTVDMRKKLIAKYPFLMPRHPFTNVPIPNYDYSFIEGEYNLPEGWFVLFLQCCEDIHKVLKKIDQVDKFYFVQIKEKWGRMTLYCHGATKEIEEIIHKYGFLSEQVCSICGKPANVMTYGYVCPYCNKCVQENDMYVDDAEIIEIKTSYTLKHWAPEGTTTEDIDCSEEWNRYIERINYENS